MLKRAAAAVQDPGDAQLQLPHAACAVQERLADNNDDTPSCLSDPTCQPARAHVLAGSRPGAVPGPAGAAPSPPHGLR